MNIIAGPTLDRKSPAILDAPMNVAQASDIAAFSPSPGKPEGSTVSALRRTISAMEHQGLAGSIRGAVPVGIAAIDGALGGGLALGALHEIAAAREAEIAAATLFALALARRTRRAMAWIAEDFGLAESGTPYGPGLDDLGFAPERLIAVTAAKARDVLWAMEEALACSGIGTAIGEIRSRERGVDLTATRRLSLAASRRDNLALLLCTVPGTEASAAATRWVVGAAPSARTPHGTGPPRLRLDLVRNRRGPLGSWTVEWNRVERCLDLPPAHRERLAEAVVHRPHRAAGA
jgi:protein ImuA